jgi:ABC-type transport system involved in multi-copper enzyme maturation permease subunit
LAAVDLAAAAERPFRTYSLGMKQRLGIAYALLGDPALIFLDESTNGLDPAGMAEVRDLIRSLGQGGRTVVLSSHLLGEVQQVADRVAILARGRLIAEGLVGELLRARDGLRVRTTDDLHTRAILIGAAARDQRGRRGRWALRDHAPRAGLGDHASPRSQGDLRRGVGAGPGVVGALFLGSHWRAGGGGIMSQLAILVRWDWFKLTRRKMPWVLLFMLLLFSQLGVWGNYFRYRNLHNTGGSVAVGIGQGRDRPVASCADLLAGKIAGLPAGTTAQMIQGWQAECRQSAAQTQLQLAQRRDDFSLPGSIPSALDSGLTVGLILLTVLTASVIGAEYGWGTIRPVLARGTGRWPYLEAKLIMLILLAGAALVVVAGATAVRSWIANRLATGPAASGAATWSDAASALGKTWAALAPYLIFTAFLTVLTQSSAVGMAIGIGYFLGEELIVAIMNGIFDWFANVTHYLLGQNISVWVGHAVLGQLPSGVSTLHAFVVLAAYAAVFGVAAFVLFNRRDVTGPTSG